MDVEMPGESGIELTQALHEKHPEVRVVMLTAFSDSERVFAALKAGAVGYLLKNVTPGRDPRHRRARRGRRADALGRDRGPRAARVRARARRRSATASSSPS